MKQRISSLDIKLLTSELEKDIKGYRLQNIYNLLNSNKNYLFKFNIPDSKKSVIVDCGSKIYATDFQRPTTQEPSNFVIKLRKHLKTKRLTNLKQVGDDRVLVMEFSSGLYYLVFEFFSAGNIILLDQDLKILSLQRLVEEKENNDKYAVGELYNLFDKTLFGEESLTNVDHVFTKDEVSSWVQSQKIINNKVLSIHKLLFLNASFLSSELIQIKLKEQTVISSESSNFLLDDEVKLGKVVDALNESNRALNLVLQEFPHKGFLISKKNPIHDPAKPDSLEFIYDEFYPFEPTFKSVDKVEQIEGYNKTLDKFFTTLELNKNSLKEQQLQVSSEKRLQLVKDENNMKISKLEELQNINVKKAELIMIYCDVVENCKKIVQTLIDQQMDWKNIEKLIQMQKQRGNEMAQFINIPLNLKENKISLSLPDVDFDDDGNENENDSTDSESDSDSDSGSDSDSDSGRSKKNSKDKKKTLNVTIDLSLSAFANSTLYFDAKRDALQKKLKTEQNASLAIKNTERKISKDLKKIEKQTTTNQVLKLMRSKLWFEKFFWFISNDGYLCISGRDNAQIDLIYYKHFNNDNDYFVSNDLENALKMIIKNPYKNKEVPPTTLMQAGIYSLSTTKAWENKIVTSPWFVMGKDVSKRDFDGSILQSGMLNVTKEKNYLPPAQLTFGIGFLWIGDNATGAKYIENRLKKDEELGFKLVDDNEVISKKTGELKTLLTKLEKDYEKEMSKDLNKELQQKNEVDSDLSKLSITGKPEEQTKLPTPYEQTQVKVRGKKAKMKKIKQKYADQDDEERKLRMQILGTLKHEQEAPKQELSNINNTNDGNEVKRDGNWRILRNKQQVLNQLKKILHELEEEDGDVDEDEAHLEEEEQKPQLVSYRESLDKLILSPLKTDIIEDVIPIFAPWSALQKYKYKLKIQPGNLKKGKVINDLIEYYKKDHAKKLKETPGDEWWDEKSLISIINQQDLLLTITVNKMKLSTGDSNNTKKGRR